MTVIWGDARKVVLPCSIDGVITSPPYVGPIDYHEQHRYAYEWPELPVRSEDEAGAAFKGASQRAHDIYRQDMIDVCMRVRESMKRGGRMILIVHDRASLSDDIAARCRFEGEGTIRRPVHRRTGRRPHAFCEDVLVWRTP